MASETGLSQTTISRMWRTFGLQPHRSESFKLSADPLFIEKTRYVVGLDMSPPENAILRSALPAAHRRRNTERLGHPPRARQLRHTQVAAGSAMVFPSSAIRRTLHANELKLAQSGRTVLC